MAKDRVAVPVVVAAACAILFFGLGSYLGARPSVDPQQELAALRAEMNLLRKQQELAPTRTAAVQWMNAGRFAGSSVSFRNSSTCSSFGSLKTTGMLK